MLTTGTLLDPGATKQSVTITGVPKKTFSYLAGGPVFEDPYSGARLMLYHAEDGGKGKSFYSMLGMAISTDPAHQEFRDLGVIIKPTLPSGNAEVGGGSFAIVNGYMNVYYNDWTADGNINVVSVARASMADLMTNALIGRSTAFNKYYNGGWSEPGLGGKSSYLETGNPANSWLGVSYNEYLNQLVMVSSQWSGDGGDLYMTTSPDGVNWAPRTPLAVDPGEQFYPSIIGANGSITRARQFYVYYTDSQKGAWGRWNDAQLRRREITITSPPGAARLRQLARLHGRLGIDQRLPIRFPNRSRRPPAGNTPGIPKAKLASRRITFRFCGATRPRPTTRPAARPWSPTRSRTTTTSCRSPPAAATLANRNTCRWPATRSSRTTAPASIASPTARSNSPAHSPDQRRRPLGARLRERHADRLAQSVPFGSGLVNFDRMLGSLNVGDTVWVMIDPLKNNNNDAFINFNFSLEKLVYSAQGALFAAGLATRIRRPRTKHRRAPNPRPSRLSRPPPRRVKRFAPPRFRTETTLSPRLRRVFRMRSAVNE